MNWRPHTGDLYLHLLSLALANAASRESNEDVAIALGIGGQVDTANSFPQLPVTCE